MKISANSLCGPASLYNPSLCVYYGYIHCNYLKNRYRHVSAQEKKPMMLFCCPVVLFWENTTMGWNIFELITITKVFVPFAIVTNLVGQSKKQNAAHWCHSQHSVFLPQKPHLLTHTHLNIAPSTCPLVSSRSFPVCIKR